MQRLSAGAATPSVLSRIVKRTREGGEVGTADETVKGAHHRKTKPPVKI